MDESGNPDNTADVSLPPSYFDEVYAANRDPWKFETSPYEAEKYGSSLAILPRPHYRHVLEVGCSIGVFTCMLALRCDHLLAIDVAEQALVQARRRCESQPQVVFERRGIPAEFPDGAFDLITVCEVGYYLSIQALQVTCKGFAQRQPEGADLLLVHWTPPVPDYPLRGDAVHDLWLSQPWWQPIAARRHASYRMDLLRRNGAIVL